MAIIDHVKWDTNNPRLLVWKFPSDELSTWTQLIVNDSQEAWLVHEGNYEGPFRAGRHVLSTENLPVLTELLKLPFGGETPFTSEVWFVSKTEVLDLKWGTIEAMQLLDPVYGILLPVRAFGQYGIRVVDGRKLLGKIVGTLSFMTADTLNENFRGAIASIVKSVISERIVKEKIPVFELSAHLDDISSDLPARLNTIFGEYGIELVRFNLMSVSVPETDSSVRELKKILAEKAKLTVLGGSYGQVRGFDVLEGAAKNEGTGAGTFLGLGMGAAFNSAMFGGAFGGASPLLSAASSIVPTAPAEPVNPDRALPMAEKIKMLKELSDLKTAGILTEAEFETQKKLILN